MAVPRVARPGAAQPATEERRPRFAEMLVRWAIDSGNEHLLPEAIRHRYEQRAKRTTIGSSVTRRLQHAS